MTAKIRIRAIFSILLVITVIAGTPIMAAKEAFFPLNQIKSGLSGIGYTVFKGTKIDRFDVKVIDVVQGGYGQSKLILVRLSGKLLEENGGLAAGMSGSPVYIKGKLAGAISYGFENADPMLAMVTPIQSMLDLLEEDKLSFSEHLLGGRKLIPVATPVIVSGLGKRGFEMISKVLEMSQLQPVFFPAAGNMSHARNSGPVLIKPGSAIAVQLVSGDYQASAIGTVTWTGNNRFLAFGHPFMNKGKVEYNVFQAGIVQTVQSRIMSFKMGTALSPIGKIIQDRNAGIVGVLGETPPMIDVDVIINDLDRKLYQGSHFKVINNEQLYPGLITSGITSAIDNAMDRVGEGTAKVKVSLETVQGKEAVLRTNIFYSKDIAVTCLKDVGDLLDIMAENEFAKVDLNSVKVDVEISKAQTTARIVKLETATTKLKPGTKLDLQAVVHTYRGSTFKIPFSFKIPEKSEPGKMLLIVHGGADAGLFGEKEGERKKTAAKLDYDQIHSFEELMADYLKTATNNQLVLEYYPLAQAEAEDIETEIEPQRITADSFYYILGEAQLILEIE